MGSRKILRDVGETVAFERRIANLKDAVEGAWARSASFSSAVILTAQPSRASLAQPTL
jgi:hypothetical protein